MSSTCKDDKITIVRNTVSSCLSLLSDPLMYRNLYADDIVERVQMEAGCDLEKVSSHVSFILEVFATMKMRRTPLSLVSKRVSLAMTSVGKIVESCVTHVSSYTSERVAEQMRGTPRCTLEMVPSF